MTDTYLRLYANSVSLPSPLSKMVQYAWRELPQFGRYRAVIGKQDQFAGVGSHCRDRLAQFSWKNFNKYGLQCELFANLAIQIPQLRQVV